MGSTIARWLDEMPDEYRAASPVNYVDRLRKREHDLVHVRKDTGHASYDNERRVEEIGLTLEFLESRMPARSTG